MKVGRDSQLRCRPRVRFARGIILDAEDLMIRGNENRNIRAGCVRSIREKFTDDQRVFEGAYSFLLGSTGGCAVTLSKTELRAA